MEKVIEVIVKEGYRRTKEKVNKIKDWLGSINVEIVVFKPIIYLDKHELPKNLYHYAQKCGFEPKSYTELDEWHADNWRKEGLEVIFMSERQLRENITEKNQELIKKAKVSLAARDK